MAQWVWNLRSELGHQLDPTPLRITEFAPAIPEQNAQAATRPGLSAAPASGFAPPTTATRLGKQATSRAQTFRSNLMGRCAVQLASRFVFRNDAEKPMEACASCMQPASAGAVPARCESLASGRVAPPKSRAR